MTFKASLWTQMILNDHWALLFHPRYEIRVSEKISDHIHLIKKSTNTIQIVWIVKIG